MITLLRELKKKVVIGFVGGSDLAKITEQLGPGKCQLRVIDTLLA
jgi:Eukaryotic phosphomannomutase